MPWSIAASSTPTPTRPPEPLPCADVDGDGQVTFRDVIAEVFALLFGSQDPRFDINRDGRVSVIDLAIVARQFGRSC